MSLFMYMNLQLEIFLESIKAKIWITFVYVLDGAHFFCLSITRNDKALFYGPKNHFLSHRLNDKHLGHLKAHIF